MNKDQQLFISACLQPDPWAFIKSKVGEPTANVLSRGTSGHAANMTQAAGCESNAPKAVLHAAIHSLTRTGVWHPGSVCRYCKGDLDAESITITYGRHLGAPAGDWYPCHKACMVDGELRETIFWQECDTACNDCLHFKRGSMEHHPGFKLFRGTCGRDGHAVSTVPGQCQPENLGCFYNRKRAQEPVHPIFAELDAMSAQPSQP